MPDIIFLDGLLINFTSKTDFFIKLWSSSDNTLKLFRQIFFHAIFLTPNQGIILFYCTQLPKMFLDTIQQSNSLLHGIPKLQIDELDETLLIRSMVDVGSKSIPATIPSVLSKAPVSILPIRSLDAILLNPDCEVIVRSGKHAKNH